MTMDMKTTELRGFPIQYSTRVIAHLTNVVSNHQPNHRDLYEICNSISPNFEHCLDPTTRDDYSWFEKIEHDLDLSRVAILFPRFSDSQMDRSINVYASRYVNSEKLTGLLESVAYQTALRSPDLSTLRFVPSRTYDKK